MCCSLYRNLKRKPPLYICTAGCLYTSFTVQKSLLRSYMKGDQYQPTTGYVPGVRPLWLTLVPNTIPVLGFSVSTIQSPLSRRGVTIGLNDGSGVSQDPLGVLAPELVVRQGFDGHNGREYTVWYTWSNVADPIAFDVIAPATSTWA
ncbi:uncharacterized protein BDW70DRAFT_143893 [Aspergillus foveolatus]|uniref:uncharacterized protein n=1 Tax=Aspergillus foveolatus TaxID=210207 RepID=UPI003CCCA63D